MLPVLWLIGICTLSLFCALLSGGAVEGGGGVLMCCRYLLWEALKPESACATSALRACRVAPTRGKPLITIPNPQTLDIIIITTTIIITVMVSSPSSSRLCSPCNTKSYVLGIENLRSALALCKT